MFIIWPVDGLVGKWWMVRCLSKWSMVLIKPYFKVTYLSLHIPKLVVALLLFISFEDMLGVSKENVLLLHSRTLTFQKYLCYLLH